MQEISKKICRESNLVYLCNPKRKEGSLAQLVQSVCLTSRGSGVRLPQLPPPERAKQNRILKSGDFGIPCFYKRTNATLHFIGHFWSSRSPWLFRLFLPGITHRRREPGRQCLPGAHLRYLQRKEDGHLQTVRDFRKMFALRAAALLPGMSRRRLRIYA